MEKRNVATSVREVDSSDIDDAIGDAAKVIAGVSDEVKKACADIAAARESARKAREADEAAERGLLDMASVK
jgi:hypothetical protein